MKYQSELSLTHFTRKSVENYGLVLRDCATVITTRLRASKAYYRAGLELLALERVVEALDVCAHVGEVVVDDPGFETLRARGRRSLRIRGRERRRSRKECGGREKDGHRVCGTLLPFHLRTTFLNSPYTVVGWASTGTKPD